MNPVIERIKEQATEDVLGVPVLNAEMFAELIVKECADLCRERKLTPSAFTADEIQDHFGVE